jgi:selenocysteine-specific elongation factor
VDPAALEAAVGRVEAKIDDAGSLGLDVSRLGERERAVLGTVSGVVVDAGRARRAGAADPLASHPYLAALADAPFAPPAPTEAGVAPAESRELVRRGLVVERDGIYFAPTAIDEAARVVARMLAASPDGITVAEVRDALGTTRKYLLPLLALLDGSGVTRRRGDVRIGGPRLPATA